jgi:hypothetical protein
MYNKTLCAIRYRRVRVKSWNTQTPVSAPPKAQRTATHAQSVSSTHTCGVEVCMDPSLM